MISVGNLTVGGTGKTPLVAWLARRLLERGRRPAIVSRGYGGRRRGAAARRRRMTADAAGPERCGDEPFLLARDARPGSP